MCCSLQQNRCVFSKCWNFKSEADDYFEQYFKCRVSSTPGNLLELFFLLEILEIFWNFAKSGNFLAKFVCLLLL